MDIVFFSSQIPSASNMEVVENIIPSGNRPQVPKPVIGLAPIEVIDFESSRNISSKTLPDDAVRIGPQISSAVLKSDE